MKKFLISILILCSAFVFGQEPVEKNYDTFTLFLKEQTSNISQINEGMTQEMVKRQMGSSLVVKVPELGKMKALNQLFKQPEFINTYNRNPKRIVNILWYFSTPKDQNGVISKNECTPMIFENDSLVGKGWTFLNTYRRSGKLR